MFWLSKLIADGIKNGLPLVEKAAKNQHSFRRDRVDDVTDLLVVKKQVNYTGGL